MRVAVVNGRLAPLICIALLVSGCSGSTNQGGMGPQGPDGTAEAIDRTRCNEDGKEVVKIDVNDDKNADVYKYFQRKMVAGSEVDILVCRSTDLNFDGRWDIWNHYDDEGNVMLEEMDLDFDGNIDLVTVRRGGKVIRQEMDTNYNGKPDIWKFYEDGTLSQVQRDSTGNGRVDYWEYYEGGKLDRIGYDERGDGQVDRWERAPAQMASAESGPEPSSADAPEGPEKKE